MGSRIIGHTAPRDAEGEPWLTDPSAMGSVEDDSNVSFVQKSASPIAGAVVGCPSIIGGDFGMSHRDLLRQLTVAQDHR